MKTEVLVGFLAGDPAAIDAMVTALEKRGVPHEAADGCVRDVLIRLGPTLRPKRLALECDENSYAQVNAAAAQLAEAWGIMGARVLAVCFTLRLALSAALCGDPTLGAPRH